MQDKTPHPLMTIRITTDSFHLGATEHQIVVDPLDQQTKIPHPHSPTSMLLDGVIGNAREQWSEARM